MARRMIRCVVSAALVGAVITACGSDDDDEGAGTSSEISAAESSLAAGPNDTATTAGAAATEDAASVDEWCPLTTEQVSAVVRHDMVEGQPCTWSAPDLVGGVLEVYVSGTDAQHLDGSTEAVEGVGDAAAFDAVDALVFEIDGAHWSVQILNMGGASDIVAKDAEVELATLVVESIG